MRAATPAFAGARGATDPVCPKCGSPEIRGLALIHEVGLSGGAAGRAPNDTRGSTALSRQAAPPVRKTVWPWATLAVGSAATLLASMRSASVVTALPVGVCAAALHLAVRASRYNRTVYPELMRLWRRSFMCARCGEIFEIRESDGAGERG